MLCDCYTLNQPEESSFTEAFRLGMTVVHVVLICVGFVGTACILTVFIWDRTLWKPSYVFIGFLAFLDMLHIAIVGSFKIGFLQLLRWTDENGCWWSGVTSVPLMTTPTVTTVVIAINRYIRVFQSKTFYNKVFHPRQIVLVCGGVTLLTCLWSTRASVRFYPSLPICFLDVLQSQIRLSLIMGQYVVGYTIVIVLYCRIIRKLTLLDRKLKPRLPSTRTTTPILTRTVTATVMHRVSISRAYSGFNLGSFRRSPPSSSPWCASTHEKSGRDSEDTDTDTDCSRSRSESWASTAIPMAKTNSQLSSSFDSSKESFSLVGDRPEAKTRPRILKDVVHKLKTCEMESKVADVADSNEETLSPEQTAPRYVWEERDPEKGKKTSFQNNLELEARKASFRDLAPIPEKSPTPLSVTSMSQEYCTEDYPLGSTRGSSLILHSQPAPRLRRYSGTHRRHAHNNLIPTIVKLKHHLKKISTHNKPVDNLKFGFVICVLNMTASVPFWICFVVFEMLHLEVPQELQCLSHLLVLCGSALNSLVYGMMNNSFRESGRKLWHRLWRTGRRRRNVVHPPVIVTQPAGKKTLHPV